MRLHHSRCSRLLRPRRFAIELQAWVVERAHCGIDPPDGFDTGPESRRMAGVSLDTRRKRRVEFLIDVSSEHDVSVSPQNWPSSATPKKAPSKSRRCRSDGYSAEMSIDWWLTLPEAPPPIALRLRCRQRTLRRIGQAHQIPIG